MIAAAKILDPCCGSRMFWFDKGDQRALFGDIRDEEHVLCNGRVLNIEPNVIMDYRSPALRKRRRQDGRLRSATSDPRRW